MGSFERLDHQVLLAVLGEKLHDNRFLRLIGTMLQAGYLEEWHWHPTYSGSPQGGICSPVLSNVYLDKLDQFVETVLLPAHNRGTLRRTNPAYTALERPIARAKRVGTARETAALRRQMRQLPSQDPHDPHYRRLRYVRYADLCGHRHKSAYADCRVMPTPVGKPRWPARARSA